jgi:hypothetical protein
MQNRWVFYALILVVIVVLLWIFGETFNQPSVHDLQEEYIETAYFRNENNTGPIIRMYAIFTPDTVWSSMKAYGEFMPHTKYGQTKVYFFNSIDYSPKQINLESPYFDIKYQPYCIAVYEKDQMGQVKFIQFPFR